ncbi:hypothetical protein BJV82DRAFT_582680 [Fennellomyces sp. T-0311]|nr:hypothetical protein BJV82DRAFT_582680 [Fennellomyces sp. T-0311]
MLTSLAIFNTLRLVTSVTLIADIAKGNWIAKSYLFEMPWIFGIGAITLYLIGIAQTISQSHSAEGWLPSPTVVDIFGITALLLPLVVGNPLTLAGGAVADRGDIETGINLIRINYGTWFVWTGGLGIAVLYAAIRLVHILRAHHKRFRQGSNYAAVKNGIYKIQMMAFSFVICLWCFATVLLLFAAIRDQIMANTVGNIIVGTAWNFLGCVTTLIVEIAVIFSPGMRTNAALRTKSSSGEGGKNSNNETSNTTRPDLIWGTTTMDPSATGTFDQEAIMEALKHNDGGKPWLQEQPQRGKNAKKFKTPQRRSSETSSQLELTSYEQ